MTKLERERDYGYGHGERVGSKPNPTNYSISYAACFHQHTVHSPNGVDMIEECPTCCHAWIINPLGAVVRLHGSKIEERLWEQKLARQAVSK